MLLAASRDVLAAQESSTYEIALPTQRYIGDLDGTVERRTIRVLTVYSKTVFFFDNGTPRGIRNIYKYYIAYKLVEEQVAETRRATEELRQGRAR
jgi:hypothetical protein